MGWAFRERPIFDTKGVTVQVTKVANLANDLNGWLWVAVIEELWDTSHDENATNNPTTTCQQPLIAALSTIEIVLNAMSHDEKCKVALELGGFETT